MSSKALEKYNGNLRLTIHEEVKNRLHEMHMLAANNFDSQYKQMCDEIIDLISERISNEANKLGWNSAVEAAVELMETGAGVDADFLKEQLMSK